MKCEAITKRGTRCKNEAVGSSTWCAHHGPGPTSPRWAAAAKYFAEHPELADSITSLEEKKGLLLLRAMGGKAPRRTLEKETPPTADLDAMTATIDGRTVGIDWFEVDGMNQASVLHLVDGRVLVNEDGTWVERGDT